ncbi:hypothetical protein R7V42_03560, partial [Mesomycoplasma ovipneumoniae]|uniref:hypothetical protein n=1 Tax=Mesomycoplasma ovipneumoniae TaxID=29562 RepID=UPI0029645C99
EKNNKSGVIKIIGKKLIVGTFSTNLAWSKIKLCYNIGTKNELINFDIELGGINYVFATINLENANFPLCF